MFFLTNAANHGLTETHVTCIVIVWRKSFNVNYFGTSDASSWDICGRSVKALLIFTSQTSRLCTWYLPVGMQEPPPCEETLHFDTVKSTVHTVPLRLFHLFSHQYKLLRSCSDLDGRNYSSQTPNLFVRDSDPGNCLQPDVVNHRQAAVLQAVEARDDLSTDTFHVFLVAFSINARDI